MRRWIGHYTVRFGLHRLRRMRRWSRWHSLVLAVLMLLFVGAAINGWSWFTTGQMVLEGIHASRQKLPPSPPLVGNLLLVSPHPDDESLAAGGMISDVIRRGGRVSIVWLTNGDAFEWDVRFQFRKFFPDAREFIDLGKVRMQEARLAAKELGVRDEDMYFLGFPDQGLMSLYTKNYLSPYRNPFTGVQVVPYQGVYRLGSPYTGWALERQLGEIFRKVNPQIILAPSLNDGHPDHRVGGYLATRLWSMRFRKSKLYYYLVHGGFEWPLPKGLHPQLALVPPQLTEDGLAWRSYDLSKESLERKQAAIGRHITQLNILSRFMWAFVRQNELLLPAPVAGLESSDDPRSIP
ncbi:MAG: PIG-L family deacetylase [Deinococcaceae bacterium]